LSFFRRLPPPIGVSSRDSWRLAHVTLLSVLPRELRSSLRLTLRAKVALIAAAAVGLGLGLFGLRMSVDLEQTARGRIRERLEAVATTTASSIDGDAHERIYAAADPEFLQIRGILRAAQNANHLGSDRISTLRPVPGAENFVTIVTLGNAPENFVGHLYENPDAAALPEFRAVMRQVLRDGRPRSGPIWSDARGTWISVFAPIRDHTGRTVALLEADDSTARVTEIARRWWQENFPFALGAIAAAAALAFFVSFRISTPVIDVTRRISAIAEGKQGWDQTVPQQGSDEIAQLAAAYNAVAARWRGLFETVGGSAEQVQQAAARARREAEKLTRGTRRAMDRLDAMRAGTEAVTDGAQQIREQTEDLSAAADQAASSAAQREATARETADQGARLSDTLAAESAGLANLENHVQAIERSLADARDAMAGAAGGVSQLGSSASAMETFFDETARQSRRVSEIAGIGRRAVEESERGLAQVAQASGRVSRTIDGLREKTRRIGAIAAAVESTASEARLLGLNASIIAEKAGEKGGAFAVVAAEVESMGNRTHQAAKEIRATLEEIRRDVSRVVDAAREEAETVGRGLPLAEEAGRQFQELMEGAERVSASLVPAARAVSEQASATRDVTRALERIVAQLSEIESAAVEQTREVLSISRQSQAMRDIALAAALSAKAEERGARESALAVRRIAEGLSRTDTTAAGQAEAAGAVLRGTAEVFELVERAVATIDRLSEVSAALERETATLTRAVRSGQG
jgi:methyl-accepting chemotaxis protein